MSTENYPLQNPDHERFIQNVANGMQPADAYLSIYTCKKRNAHKSASRLMQRPEIRDRLRHLQTCNAEVSMWKRSDAMDILRQIAENPNKKDCDRINAVKYDDVNDLMRATLTAPHSIALVGKNAAELVRKF